MPIAVQCNKCGSEVDTAGHFCGNCGAEVPRSITSSGCGAPIKNTQAFCGNCGAPIQRSVVAPTQPQGPEPIGYAFSGLSEYYRDEFIRIHQSRETYKGKWNWAAFFFGPIWALTKGLWVPALIAFVGAIFTDGLVGVIYWFIFAARGNYMYYCKELKNKDIPI